MRGVLLLSVAATAACGGGGGGGHASARARAADAEPARLAATPVASAVEMTFHVHVRAYADAGYRSHHPSYQAHIERLVRGALEILGPTAGVQLDGVDVRSWERGEGTTLEGALSELENLDPAEDVDWVIGFMDAQPAVATDMHQLGEARVLGRHLVVRGLDDRAEAKLLDDVLATVPARARHELLARRKRHKELVVLLHELGHTLGAMHVTDEARLMATSYEATQSSYGRENAELMAVAMAARFVTRLQHGKPEEEWRAVLAHIRKHPYVGWNEDERSALVAELEARVKSEEAGTAGVALGQRVRPADRDRFRSAERIAAAGRALDAWTELEPLIEFYPDEPGVHRLACRLSVSSGRDLAATATRCARAGELDPADPEPFVRLAQAQQGAGDRAKAIAAAAEAARRLGPVTAATAPLATELAAVYQTLGLMTLAEKTAPPDAAELRAWAAHTRARYGVAPGGGVAPEREAEYVEAIRGLLQLVYARKFPEAEKRAAALRRDYGDAPGLEGALCDLEIRRRKYPAARAHCQKALASYDGAAWAHYLIALLDKRDKKPDDALRHLERAIALDPELENAYQVAVQMYSAAGKADGAARVRAAFKKQFSRDLP